MQCGLGYIGVSDVSDLLTVRDVSERLRISTRQCWKLLSAGKLPAPVRLSRSVRWRVDDIVGWVALGCPNREEFEAQKKSKEGMR